MAPKKILLICGEASGELRAAELVSSFKKLDPQIRILAIGGDLLRSAGAEVFFEIKGLAVMGLFDVLKKIPQFLRLKNIILDKVRSEAVDAVIFVDFSGFNLRLAKALNNRVKTIYYVSPQVWASRKGRIQTIRKFIQKMIVLFKFEEEFYRQNSIAADFVGHPLIDSVKPTNCKEKLLSSLGLPLLKPTIALLPGSRKQEISQVLPVMLEAAKLINADIPAQFIIAKSKSVDLRVYQQVINANADIEIKMVEGKTYDCLNAADFALVCSGTATLEAAIIGVPLTVIYKTNLPNYLLYRPLIRVPFIGMVNIVAGRKIVPEFVQFGARPKKIAKYALSVLRDPAKQAQIKEDLSKVKSSLGSPGAASRAAQIIINFLQD